MLRVNFAQDAAGTVTHGRDARATLTHDDKRELIALGQSIERELNIVAHALRFGNDCDLRIPEFAIGGRGDQRFSVSLR